MKRVTLKLLVIQFCVRRALQNILSIAYGRRSVHHCALKIVLTDFIIIPDPNSANHARITAVRVLYPKISVHLVPIIICWIYLLIIVSIHVRRKPVVMVTSAYLVNLHVPFVMDTIWIVVLMIVLSRMTAPSILGLTH